MRLIRVWLVLSCAIAVLVPGAALAAPASDSVADITVEFSCDDGGYVVTSSKDLSNIVVRDGDVDTRTTFEEGIQQTFVPTGDVTTIWVKSGSERSGDGPGYGKRFDVEPGTCDADGDGFTDDVDCDDSDPGINPGAVDQPNDDIDQDCDGTPLVITTGELRVTAVWDTDDDLDLHVVDPAGDRVWWMTDGTPSGGILDRDDNVAVCGTDTTVGGVENIIWPEDPAPPAGTYIVELYSFNDCQPAGTSWTVQVFIDDVLVHTDSGTTTMSGGTGQDSMGALLYSHVIELP